MNTESIILINLLFEAALLFKTSEYLTQVSFALDLEKSLELI